MSLGTMSSSALQRWCRNPGDLMRNKNSEGEKTLVEFWSCVQHFLDVRRQAGLRAGLSSAQYEMLLAVRGFREPGEPYITAVAKQLVIRQRVAARVVKRLMGQGLLHARPSAADRRTHILQLTAKGKRLLDRLASNSMGGLEIEGPVLAKSLVRVIRQWPR